MLQTLSQNDLSNEINAEWTQVCLSLRQILGDSTYSSWLKPLGAGQIKSGRAKLFAPTRFMRDWVAKHYLSDIESTWQKHNPNVQGIDFEVNPACVLNNSSSDSSQPYHNFTIAEKEEDSAQSSPATGSYSQPAVSKTFSLATVQGQDDFANSLDSRFTFSNFVVGKTNEFAFLAAKKVAESRQVTFKPLFLHSGVGLGKTHLMQAIANYIRENDPTRRVLYLSAEKFMYKFISALRSNDSLSFKDLFRSVDVLMVDDIQFIAGKDATQEEFFHTFNALMNAGKQIVLSADKAPSELKGIEARLKSRFSAGLEVDIHPATYELRLGILASKADSLHAYVPSEVLEFLASNISSNIRELEGALNRLIAHSELMGEQITLENTQNILKDLISHSQIKVSLDDIQSKTAEYFKVRIADLKSCRRQREISRPRQIAMYLSKTLTTKSLPDIGRMFDRDHTTVMHAVKTIESLIKTDARIAEDVLLLTRKLGV